MSSPSSSNNNENNNTTSLLDIFRSNPAELLGILVKRNYELAAENKALKKKISNIQKILSGEKFEP